MSAPDPAMDALKYIAGKRDAVDHLDGELAAMHLASDMVDLAQSALDAVKARSVDPTPADLNEAIDRLAGADMTTGDRPMSALVYAALADRNEGRLSDEACRAVRVARGGKPRSAPDDRVLLSVLAASPPVGEEFALLRELRRRRRVAEGELPTRARVWMGVDVNERAHLERDAGDEPSV